MRTQLLVVSMDPATQSSVLQGSHTDHRDQKGEEASDVENENEGFDFGQERTEEKVDHNGEAHDDPVAQRALPLCW